MLEMLYQQGAGDFNQGGRVGKYMGGMSDEQRKSGGSTHSSKPSEGPDNSGGFNVVSSETNKTVNPDGTFYSSSSDFTNPDTGDKQIFSKVQTPSFFQRMLTLPSGLQDIMNVDDEGKTFSTNYLTGPQTLKVNPFNQGGRVGMFAGGSLIGKGIMEAAKLAARGVKPFGAKQTYKQNVKNMGLSNFDQVEVVTSKQIDELRNANDVDGLFEMLEDVVSGKKFGMANPAQRKVLQENIEEALNDIPLNRDSRERLSEDYFNMMEYYKPAPKETGKVIPFKPKTKKANGGTIPPLKGPASDGMGSLFRRK